jgi:hypothetical protein
VVLPPAVHHQRFLLFIFFSCGLTTD